MGSADAMQMRTRQQMHTNQGLWEGETGACDSVLEQYSGGVKY